MKLIALFVLSVGLSVAWPLDKVLNEFKRGESKRILQVCFGQNNFMKCIKDNIRSLDDADPINTLQLREYLQVEEILIACSNLPTDTVECVRNRLRPEFSLIAKTSSLASDLKAIIYKFTIGTLKNGMDVCRWCNCCTSHK